ncbi:class I SAM-dependent methyltransferase [bacterium]|nr:class I SAM-dependent methyltransferase [bacterium]
MTERLDKINKKAEIANQAFWDEITPIHYKSYDIEKLKQGKSLIDEIQKKEMGDVKDKSLLHLQCHIGTDSLSWALEGAQVTGIDFSSESIKIANKLKSALGLKARFIESNIYDLPDTLKEKFDIVYASQGVLIWLKDIKEWGKIISHYLKPGGIFYLMETHPLFYIFDNDKQGRLKIKYSYFPGERSTLWDDDTPDYSDREYIPKNPTYEWTWPLGEILTSLIEAGLKIEFLHEYDRLFYKGFPDMVKDEEGWWYLPKYKGMLPLTFTLRAKKNLPKDHPMSGFKDDFKKGADKNN